jgi:hypothetical protein
MNIENIHQFSSETEHFARRVIEAGELSPTEKLEAAYQLKRIADKISLHVASLRGKPYLPLSDQQDETVAAWLREFGGRG